MQRSTRSWPVELRQHGRCCRDEPDGRAVSWDLNITPYPTCEPDDTRQNYDPFNDSDKQVETIDRSTGISWNEDYHGFLRLALLRVCIVTTIANAGHIVITSIFLPPGN